MQQNNAPVDGATANKSQPDQKSSAGIMGKKAQYQAGDTGSRDLQKKAGQHARHAEINSGLDTHAVHRYTPPSGLLGGIFLLAIIPDQRFQFIELRLFHRTGFQQVHQQFNRRAAEILVKQIPNRKPAYLFPRHARSKYEYPASADMVNQAFLLHDAQDGLGRLIVGTIRRTQMVDNVFYSSLAQIPKSLQQAQL